MCFFGEVGAKTIVVAKDGSGDYEKIQDGIDIANKNDTIRVYDGVFQENVVVNKSLNLIGNGTENTTIDGGGNGIVINISADYVNISKFFITGSGDDWVCAGIKVFSPHCVISNCNISNNHKSGIILNFSYNNTISGCNFFNNGYGIWLDNSVKNTISYCNISYNFWSSIYLEYSNNNTILNCIISKNNVTGIKIARSTNNKIKNNKFLNNGIYLFGDDLYEYIHIIENNTINGKSLLYYKNGKNINLYGIEVGQIIIANCSNFKIENVNIGVININFGIQLAYSENIIVSNCNISINEGYDIYYGIYLYYSKNIKFFNSSISNALYSIWFYNSYNNIISSCEISNNWCGIMFLNSTNNTILNNNVSNNNHNGIELKNSDNNTISNSNLSNNGWSLGFDDSNNNIISKNNISNNRYGITLTDSINNSISRCNISNNYYYSTRLSKSSNITISNNSFFNEGITISGDSLSYYIHTIINNTVNGRPLLYYKNREDIKLNGVAVGQIILANCSDFIILNINISNIEIGLKFAYSENNTFSSCNILNNEKGIEFTFSENNTIMDCNILKNNYGISISSNSNNNTIFHNNFINIKNAYDSGCNQWDNSTEGNFWDDYEGEDNDADGIGDTPYNIPKGDNQDRYPLMYLWGINDTTPPEIKNIINIPDQQAKEEYVNIYCDVTDNARVNIVKVNITYPDNSIVNITMSKGTHYFYSTNYTQLGTYYYFIWVNDTKGNSNISSIYTFIIKEKPNITWVDNDFDEGTHGWQYDHFDKIQNGIDAVSENGTVYVFNGNYYENIMVNKTIIFIGNGSGNTTIDGGRIGDVVDIRADNVEISKFFITGSGDDREEDAGIKVYTSNNKISDCKISNNEGNGIKLNNSSNNTISYCNISNNDLGIRIQYSNNNTFSNCNISNNIWDGILVKESSNNNIIRYCDIIHNDYGIRHYDSSNNTISSCNISNNNARGFYIHNSSNSMILNSNISKNDNDGIFLHYSNKNIISNCNFSKNGGDGIHLSYINKHNNISTCNTSNNNGRGIFLYDYSSYNNISYCTSNQNLKHGIALKRYSSNNNITHSNNSNNSDYGIYIKDYSTYNNISYCTIDQNSKHGIALNQFSSYNKITNCTISKNKNNSIYLYESKNNFIYHNKIINNSYQAYDGSLNFWDDGLEGNFWSDYNGTDENKDGIGDTPYYIEGGENKDNYPLMGPIKNTLFADFEYIPKNPKFIDIIEFINLSICLEGNIISYYWDFGDGCISYEKNPKHKYSHKNEYFVKLVILDEDNSRDECSKKISFINMKPIVNFSYLPTEPTTWEVINFIDTSFDDEKITKLQWNFGDGNTSNIQNPNHFYEKKGNYNVILKVWDNLGEPNETVLKIHIKNSPPYANFGYYPDELENNKEINFTDLSTDLDGEIISWHWDFGDGNESHEQNPVHKYFLAGIYEVTLTVMDNDGANNTLSLKLNVVDMIPPKIIQINPFNDSKDISVNTQILITFSENMNQVSVNNSILISPLIYYTISWQDNIINIKPTSKLKYETTYKILIYSTATDLVKNNLLYSYQFFFTTEKAPDITPPSIFHTPISIGIEGKSIKVLAKITDDEEVKNVNLFYKKKGTKYYKEIQMQQTGENYIATIPASDVTISGIEYYIWVTDGKNNATFPSDNPQTNPHKFNVNPDPAKSLPDLKISSEDIIFSTQNPKDGETIQIFVNVSNIGPVNATNVIIGFYNSDDLIQKITLNSIKAGGQTSFYFNFTGNQGTNKIRIVIDPENEIKELNETNNEAFKEIIYQKGNDSPIVVFLLVAALVVLISLIFTINLWYPTKTSK